MIPTITSAKKNEKPLGFRSVRLHAKLYERGGKKFFRALDNGLETQAGEFTFKVMGQPPKNHTSSLSAVSSTTAQLPAASKNGNKRLALRRRSGSVSES